MSMKYYHCTKVNHIVGVEDGTDPLVIADCLSAVISIPLGTKIKWTDDGFEVAGYKYIYIPMRVDYGRYDRIYKNKTVTVSKDLTFS